MKVKISLAGDLGSGKSTVSKILIDELDAEYYSTGRVVRDIAERRNMTVVELNKYMETHPEIDHEIDDGLVALSDVDKSLVIDSRMAWHFTKGTFKVYLSTDIETSAIRIMGANRQGEHSATLEETVKSTVERRESEKKRYREQYGVNIKDLSNYDLVVDTTFATPSEVAAAIIGGLGAWLNGKLEPTVLNLSPERINYPDVTPDNERVSALAAELELGGQLKAPELCERDGEFYLVSGLEEAMAYAFNMSTYVPAKLLGSEIPDVEYVKMKNSL